jgi:2-dehydro-3-deoxyphosphogalactonate aldolase
MYAVGGAGPANFGEWFNAGITGFGIGTALYQPGDSLPQLRKAANEIVRAYDCANKGGHENDQVP